ncbi:Transglutaminase-like superfamily protein [compost metagenome]
MTRSVGIPTKLVMGTSEYVTAYHAWNEVYVNEEWITIDTTIDAGLISDNGKTMIKDSTKYEGAKFY